jgi:hypothetical protein
MVMVMVGDGGVMVVMLVVMLVGWEGKLEEV